MFEGKFVKLADDRYAIVIGEEGGKPVEIGVLVWTGSSNVRYCRGFPVCCRRILARPTPLRSAPASASPA